MMESLKRRFIYTEAPAVVDIYYGTGTTELVTADYILSTFSTETGFIGSPPLSGGRLYSFGSVYSFRFWVILDLPNNGDRVMMEAKYSNGSTILGMQPANPWYGNKQIDPEPFQTIKYGKMQINGIEYRIYRTATKYSISNLQFRIYSY